MRHYGGVLPGASPLHLAKYHHSHSAAFASWGGKYSAIILQMCFNGEYLYSTAALERLSAVLAAVRSGMYHIRLASGVEQQFAKCFYAMLSTLLCFYRIAYNTNLVGRGGPCSVKKDGGGSI
jgi:hypothetical protein